MTRTIEIDPRDAEPVFDIEKELERIHFCLEQLKEGLLPGGGKPWSAPRPPAGWQPDGGDGWPPHVPHPKIPDEDGLTPVRLLGKTILEPLVVPPVELDVTQPPLSVSFQLYDLFSVPLVGDIKLPYVGAKVSVKVDTAPFGGVANIGLPRGTTAMRATGTTDAAGIATFGVQGLGAGMAALVAKAKSQMVTVDFIVN